MTSAHLAPFITETKSQRVYYNLSTFTWKQWRVWIQYWAGFWFGSWFASCSLWRVKRNCLAKRIISARPDSDTLRCIELCHAPQWTLSNQMKSSNNSYLKRQFTQKFQIWHNFITLKPIRPSFIFRTQMWPCLDPKPVIKVFFFKLIRCIHHLKAE